MNRKIYSSLLTAGLAGCFLLACGGCSRDPAVKEAQFLKSGRTFLEKKDYPRAILQFRNASERRPLDPEPYYQLGLAFLGKGDPRQAAAFFRKTLQLQPKHPGASLKFAEIMASASNRENVEQGEKMAMELVAASPDNLEALDTLASAQLRLGKNDDAEKNLMEALRRVPAHLEASVGVARVKVRRKDFAGAEQALKDAVASNPKAVEPLVILGEFYIAMRRTTDGERTLRSALVLKPSSGQALTDLGALLMNTGRAAEAGGFYLRLAATGEKAYRPLHAQYLFTTGKRAESILEFEKLSSGAPDDREARSRLVAAYLAVGRTADAGKLLSAALKKNGKDVDALLERSQILLREGRYNDAQMDLHEALHYRPDSAPVHYALSKVHQARGAVQNRKQELNETLRLQPAWLSARMELAQILTTPGDAKSAIELLDQAPPQQREMPGVQLQRNWALIASGNPAAARATLDRLLTSGRAPAAVLQDSVLRFRARDFAGSRAAAEEVLKADPANLGALAILMDTAVAQGQAAKGVEQVRAAALRQPANAPVQQFLGQVLAASKDPAGARKAFEQVQAINPNSAAASLALARLDIDANRLDEARRRLNAPAVAGAEAFILLGNLEERANRHEQAVAAYRKVLQYEPQNAPTLNNLAYLLADSSGQPDEALKLAQQAKELSPTDAAVDDTLGWAYFRKGIYPTAVKHLESSASRQPTARREYHLAMAYWKVGDQKHGREALRSALRMDPALPESAAALRIMGTQNMGAQ